MLVKLLYFLVLLILRMMINESFQTKNTRETRSRTIREQKRARSDQERKEESPGGPEDTAEVRVEEQQRHGHREQVVQHHPVGGRIGGDDARAARR